MYEFCSGKLKDLQDRLAAGDIDTVIFDDELKPGQMRALEKVLGSKVSLCDRTALILDIFSQRAASREGQLQVTSLANPYLRLTWSLLIDSALPWPIFGCSTSWTGLTSGKALQHHSKVQRNPCIDRGASDIVKSQQIFRALHQQEAQPKACLWIVQMCLGIKFSCKT